MGTSSSPIHVKFHHLCFFFFFFFFFWGGGASIYILGKEHIAALLHLTNSEAHYLEEKILCRGLEMHRSINELMISQMIGLKRLKLINHALP